MNKIPKHKPNNNYAFNTKNCCNKYFIAATDILFPIIPPQGGACGVQMPSLPSKS